MECKDIEDTIGEQSSRYGLVSDNVHRVKVKNVLKGIFSRRLLLDE